MELIAEENLSDVACEVESLGIGGRMNAPRACRHGCMCRLTTLQVLNKESYLSMYMISYSISYGMLFY